MSKNSGDVQLLQRVPSDLQEKMEEMMALKAEKRNWEVERRRLERESQVQDDKLKDLARDLGLSKEAEARANERYGKAFEYTKEVEGKIDELQAGFEEEKRDLIVKITSLKEKEEALRRMNKAVSGEKTKLDDLVEQLRVQLREKEDELKKREAEMRKREVYSKNYYKVVEEFEGAIREKTETIRELTEKIEELEKGNDDSESTLELVRKIDELQGQLYGIVNMKDVRIGELVREKEGLERENKEIIAKYKDFEERFLEFEADVVSHLCMEVKQDEKLASSKIGLIISSILEADSGFVSQVHDTKCTLKPETNSEETVKTTVVSEEEMSGEDGPAFNLNNLPPDCIDITESDDDEITPDVSDCKREKERPIRLSQERSEDSSSDESLNPKRKIQKLEQVVGEPTKRGQSIGAFASTIDHKLTTPHKHTLPAIRKCEKTSNKGKEGSDYKTVSRSNKIEEYMAKCQEKLEKNAVFSVTDIVCACDNDPVFCAKAVCSLNRKGILRPGQGGYEKSDIERATAVAECLVNGDPNSDKMKSLDDLKQSNSGGFDICRKLVVTYRDLLFKIFKGNEDPLFSELSTDMQDIGRQ